MEQAFWFDSVSTKCLRLLHVFKVALHAVGQLFNGVYKCHVRLNELWRYPLTP